VLEVNRIDYSSIFITTEVMPTLEEVGILVDEDEIFLSQVQENFCSPDCNSLASKSFNILSSVQQPNVVASCDASDDNKSWS